MLISKIIHKKKNIPDKVIGRLSLYHFILDDCGESEKYISSTRFAELLNIDNSQVRKDIKYLNNTGKCRVGYNVERLKASIEECLGFREVRDVFIIGAGNLGSALAKYDSFNYYGLNIKALFDTDESKIGNTVNNRKIYHISKLPQLAKKYNVDVAIITVPREHAQETAEFLAESGINYLWNFTTCILDVPNDVKVLNENLIGNFLQFTQH